MTDPGPPPTADPGPRAPDALSLTVDELAARAGVTVRTVRFYGTRGLLPPPAIGPRRVGRYGPEHLSRLALIEELQHQGMTLSAIERYLDALPPDLTAHDLAIHRALVAAWAPDSPAELSRADLERRAGRALSDTDLDRLTAMNVVSRAPDGPDFRVDPGLLRLGVALLDVPIGHDTILRARDVLMEQARATAHELTRLFRDEVWSPFTRDEDDPERVESMKALSAHMRPLVAQALMTAFQRSLSDELRTAFTDSV
ncbi:MerR family transcriptional regulator [Streptomyces sp. BI20]|uniref:MerR family transcriptional regulator n=1 Tax=Streptomyces sp. BI20 TaxID=3403460 RepID=UPI003C777319